MAPPKKSATSKHADSPDSASKSESFTAAPAATNSNVTVSSPAATTASSVDQGNTGSDQGVSSGAIDASLSSSPMDVDEPTGDSVAGAQQSTVSAPSSSLVVAESPMRDTHNLVQQNPSLNFGSLSNDSSSVNSTTSSNVNVPQEFASTITTDERVILLDEIERLKAAVFRATVTSIKCPQGSIVPNNLGVLTRQLETAQRTYQLVFGNTETTVVPNETPYF